MGKTVFRVYESVMYTFTSTDISQHLHLRYHARHHNIISHVKRQCKQNFKLAGFIS